ncbi:MAG: hypothetical protein BEN19_06745 [Epulopiscium sp. Nuni2H_MBin003]|nr:MAG: hypothetical protein BEN19_06745 [Epulopiscium sp. Nuni2H_MBin003]
MKPLYEFKHILIELTNACTHTCSNCSRFCGHHTKPFYMDWDTFKNAVDSLEGWPRIVGLMGGEPTMHPQFERFTKYAQDIHPMRYNIGGGAKPTKNLSKYIEDANYLKAYLVNKIQGVGLWTSVSANYYKHYELIQDTFVYQCINDHTAVSMHAPWFLPRAEFGIPDDEWIELRDKCWWQTSFGSPSITPKGAFFCEVAAAMDMLFDGPGGWKVEKNWWQRGPEDFKEQLKWCELCSAPLVTEARDANEEIDDVSTDMYNKLIEIGSPKAKTGKIKIHDIKSKQEVEIKPRLETFLYQTDNSVRFTSKNKSLYPKRVCGVLWTNNKIELNTNELDDVTVIDKNHTERFIELAKYIRKEVDWIVLMDNTIELPKDFRHKLSEIVFNPGTFHIINDNVSMFNVNASALKNTGFASITRINNLDEFKNLWNADKQVALNEHLLPIDIDDIELWKKEFIKKGISNFPFTNIPIDKLVIKNRVKPMIDEILAKDIPRLQKIEQLNAIDIQLNNPELLCLEITKAIDILLDKPEATCEDSSMTSIS